MSEPPDQRLAATARRQHGVFTRGDALRAGFAPRTVRARVDHGLWRELHPGVLAAATSPLSALARAHAALLWLPAAVLSHLTAAAVWGLDVPTTAQTWLTVPWACAPAAPPDVVVMRTRHPHGMRHRGVRITPVQRTVVDLAAVLGRHELSAALMSALSRVSMSAVLSCADRLGGRAGLELLRSVAEELTEAFESVLELEFARLLHRHGVVGLVPQHVVQVGGRVARLDFADPARRIAIEVDGWAYHHTREQLQRDRERDRMLVAAGWRVVRFTTDDVRRNPARTAAEVVAMLQGVAA